MSIKTSPKVTLIEDETKTLLKWARAVTESTDTYFTKGQKLARRLGAHYRWDGLTEIGFWTPELTAEVIQSERQLDLEVFTPLEPVDFRQPEQTVRFQRERVPVMQQGEFTWAVVAGMQPGNRDQAGSFYWLRHVDPEGRLVIIRDPLAYSLPYGVFAPAELYDIRRLQRSRGDLAYFRLTGAPASRPEAEIPRVTAPTNILQIHPKTAAAEGTLEGLTHIYQRISEKLAQQESLTPEEEIYVGYDAIQLLPVEPTIEYRREDRNFDHEFFAIAPPILNDDHEYGENCVGVDITLRKSNTQNWGYDVPILGSAATNPAVLGSLRPDEVVDFIATLHNFSQGPILLIYDLVYGHADNQALELLTQQFFKGPNMYGQDLNHQLPQVRAILLEMQRRKINTGADGVRVDGGQDFRFFNPLTGLVEQDDAYLLAMSDVVQEIQGCRRLLFTIFEDGRPWPQEGWEEISRYRELIELKPDSYQWGPLIFAHNTPTLKGYWDRKWRRVCEVIFQGDAWITGCGNHDTVRRGNQIAPESDAINWNLGQTLPEVLHRAYNNPATLTWVHGFSPGLPMDFLNATVGTAWGFFRNTDDRYGVKVVSEEVGFLDWQIEPAMYEREENFPRLKALGFQDFDQLRGFAKALRDAMVETDYDLEAVAQVCQHCLGPSGDPTICEVPNMEELNTPTLPRFLATLDVPKLKLFALAFMEDGHDICNVARHVDDLDAKLVHFCWQLREFRRQHPWLQENLTGQDRFNRISDDQRTVFYGWRCQPCPGLGQSPQQVVMLAHMGGEPMVVAPGDWLQLDMEEWTVAIASPDFDPAAELRDLRAFEMRDGQGILLRPLTEAEKQAKLAVETSPPVPEMAVKATTPETAVARAIPEPAAAEAPSGSPADFPAESEPPASPAKSKSRRSRRKKN